MPFIIKIVTPERTVLEETVDSATATTEMGEVTILPGHIPLVAALKPGEIRLKKGSEEFLLATSTGFLQVGIHGEVSILADTAERVEELELSKIEEARERARALMEEKRHADDVSFAAAAAALERELARYRVAVKKHRRIPRPPGGNEA